MAEEKDAHRHAENGTTLGRDPAVTVPKQEADALIRASDAA